jgi:transposase
VWLEDPIAERLSIDEGPTLYVSGTVSNQGRSHPQFDAMVLLSAPAEVLLRRVDGSTTNRYGKMADQRETYPSARRGGRTAAAGDVYARDRFHPDPLARLWRDSSRSASRTWRQASRAVNRSNISGLAKRKR